MSVISAGGMTSWDGGRTWGPSSREERSGDSLTPNAVEVQGDYFVVSWPTIHFAEAGDPVMLVSGLTDIWPEGGYATTASDSGGSREAPA